MTSVRSVPEDRIKRCAASVALEQDEPEANAIDLLSRVIAGEIAKKLVEFNKYSVITDENGRIALAWVDVIVPDIRNDQNPPDPDHIR